MKRIVEYLDTLASYLGTNKQSLLTFYEELCHDTSFLKAINANVKDVPQFEGKQFEHVDELHAYRCMLYVLVRHLECEIIVETGVLHGFSSAFILLGLQHNGFGQLLSVDLPGIAGVYKDQATAPLPPGKQPGWLIPDKIKTNQTLYLGTSVELLPVIFRDLKQPIDMFLHDSEHTYVNMMFEMSLAYPHLRNGGILICDNAEYNSAFEHFSQGMGSLPIVVYSYDTPTRVWKHGILKKPVMYAESQESQ